MDGASVTELHQPEPERGSGLGLEHAVRESEEHYRRLVELCPDAIAIHADGAIVFANSAAARLLGAAKPEDLIGAPIMDFVHPDYRDMVRERVRAETEDGQSVPLVEERFIRLDGAVIDVEVAGMPFVYEGRNAGQIVVRDITERKRTEEALRRQNEYLSGLHETALALVNRLEVSSLLPAILSRAAGLAGTDHAYIYLVEPERTHVKVEVGLGVFEPFVGNRLARGEGVAGKVWDTGLPLAVADYDTWEARSPAFPYGVLHAALGVPLTSAGEGVGVIGLAHPEPGIAFGPDEVDVLTRFGHLASLALESARSHEREQEAARRLRALDELRTTFLRAVSHELRTPLSAILGLALTLDRDDVHLSPDQSHDLVRRLARNARKLERLLSDLLDLDRLDRGILEPRRRPTDVGKLVRHAVEQSESLVDRHIEFVPVETVAEVDAPKVERIVENLLANVARYTPEGSRVWIRVEAAGDGVLIVVEDDGPGVPDDLRESIFQPFNQGRDRLDHSPGVGVGLSLVARFAELHGGRAWVEDREGGGASFRVLLPGG